MAARSSCWLKIIIMHATVPPAFPAPVSCNPGEIFNYCSICLHLWGRRGQHPTLSLQGEMQILEELWVCKYFGWMGGNPFSCFFLYSEGLIYHSIKIHNLPLLLFILIGFYKKNRLVVLKCKKKCIYEFNSKNILKLEISAKSIHHRRPPSTSAI